MWLRQSTAGQEILLGPFLDSTDGNTAETGLTIANTDIKIWKEGATTEANKNSGGATHIAAGRYYAVLDATDSNTLGKLEVNVHVTGALAVRRSYMVLPANVYDSLVLDTDNLDAEVATMAANVITAAAIANDAITAAKIATDAIDNDAIAANAVTEIQSGLATQASVNTIDSNVDAILVDTGELQTDWANGGRLDLLIDQIISDIAALNDISAADVNSQVLDVLNTDTFAEPTGVPAATTTLSTKLGYLYMALRNQVDVTATKKTFYDDGGTAEWEKDLSDDGTTYSETEANAI